MRKIQRTEYCTAHKKDGYPCEAMAKVWLPDGVGFCYRHMPVGWISSSGGELYPDPEFQQQLDSEGGPKPEPEGVFPQTVEPGDPKDVVLLFKVAELKDVLERAYGGEEPFWILLDLLHRRAQ